MHRLKKDVRRAKKSVLVINMLSQRGEMLNKHLSDSSIETTYCPGREQTYSWSLRLILSAAHIVF